MRSISGNMIVQDEEDNVEWAIRSVNDILEELVVVDNMSTDGTKQVIVRTCDELGLPLQYIMSDKHIRKTRWMAIEASKMEWIFLVDGDHIYYDWVRKRAPELVREDRYYLSRYWMLYGDWDHTIHKREFIPHAFLFPNEPEELMMPSKGNIPVSNKWPREYLEPHCAVDALGVKPFSRVYSRISYMGFWAAYQKGTLEEYAARRRPSEEEMQRDVLDYFNRAVIPRDFENPEILGPEECPYRLLKEDGRIVGRSPDMPIQKARTYRTTEVKE